MQRWKIDLERGQFFLYKAAPEAPKLLFRYMAYQINKMLQAQGMGRHSEQEMLQIARTDFESLSNFLGTLVGQSYMCMYIGMIYRFDFVL